MTLTQSHISPETHLISKAFFRVLWPVALGLLLGGCSTPGPKAPRPATIERVYQDQFENVWRAVQISFSRYPLLINNMDKGVVETDTIKGLDAWTPPHQKKGPGPGTRYRLRLQMVKGRANGRPAIRVAVEKLIRVKRDFFSEDKLSESDGLEEKVILYRIGRELAVDRAFRRIQARKQKATGE